MKRILAVAVAALVAAGLAAPVMADSNAAPAASAAPQDAAPDSAANLKAVKEENGEWFAANGTPTFHVDADGTVDWYTYSGFRRYANCMVCHGPDGAGSSYAPAIADSVLHMTYDQFLSTVTNGKKNVDSSNNKVMPAFGTDPNVMCYINDIYTYLKARGANAIPRGRPQNHAPAPEAFREAENACMG